MRLADAQPGQSLRVDDPDGRWAIWTVLTGDDLAYARELGYDTGNVVACIYLGTGRKGRSTRDPDGTPKYLERADCPLLNRREDWLLLDAGIPFAIHPEN